uniref:Uncharacterized protein n=1 Tax=Acrobeloides nanus TaxID=290746 RepID=A0A914D8P2_9BILA
MERRLVFLHQYVSGSRQLPGRIILTKSDTTQRTWPGLQSHPAIHTPYYGREQLTQHGKDTMECATERSEDYNPADQACSNQSEKVLQLESQGVLTRTEFAVN